MPGARWPSLSTSMSRWAVCGCANACGTVLTARGHTGTHQLAAEIVGLEGGQRPLQFGAERRDVVEPVGIGPETRIVEQIAAPHLLAEAAELAVIEDTEKYLAVGGRELVVG